MCKICGLKKISIGNGINIGLRKGTNARVKTAKVYFAGQGEHTNGVVFTSKYPFVKDEYQAVDVIAVQLPDETEDWRDSSGKIDTIAGYLLNQYKSIQIFGYSYGGYSATKLAEKLSYKNVSVQLTLIDGVGDFFTQNEAAEILRIGKISRLDIICSGSTSSIPKRTSDFIDNAIPALREEFGSSVKINTKKESSYSHGGLSTYLREKE